MTTLQPETVAIRQLRICSKTGADNTRMTQEAARLRQDLEWADWPDASGESWVFIRRLHAKGLRSQVVQQLVQDARQHVQGDSGDNVVRFTGLTEMLTALLTDLVQTGTPRPWYWQRWAHLFALSLPRAVADLLTDHLAHLPAVCATLARHGKLAQVWLSLDEENAWRLQHALAWRGGFSLPKIEAIQHVQGRIGHAYQPEAEHIRAEEQGHQRIEKAALRISSAVHRRWQPLLQGLSAADARYQLGLLVIGQEVAPLMLQQAPADLLARLLNMFGSRDTVRLNDHAKVAAGTSPAQQLPQPMLLLREDVSVAAAPVDTVSAAATLHDEVSDLLSHATPDPGDPATIPPKEPPVSRSTRTDTAVGADGSLLSTDAACRSNQNDPSANQSAQPIAKPLPRLRFQAQDHDLAFDQFHTGQGGLLYLLNVLNRSEIQSLMEKWWHQLPNGWGWLYRLGQELQLDETDPITSFLATQLGFDHRTELEQLPPLPVRTKLLELAGRWYGRAALWQPDLLLLTARIHFTPSHVDMFLPLSTVQLPVRLAGLDINPGWLPWLGRVVTFHYD
ncbi:hypothetical protein [uncultured Desulfobulbus sp.]|uniref:hypothetical protein n=1 Tax=uncultured Desulfobulbus sp. TaxID=239745 RepID=UPI0029C6FBB6|nr:hypothetical protein [uncultured Desulfobulbus sp.]